MRSQAYHEIEIIDDRHSAGIRSPRLSPITGIEGEKDGLLHPLVHWPRILSKACNTISFSICKRRRLHPALPERGVSDMWLVGSGTMDSAESCLDCSSPTDSTRDLEATEAYLASKSSVQHFYG